MSEREALVEAVAEAIYNSTYWKYIWEQADDDLKDESRDAARAALAVATPAIETAMLERLIAKYEAECIYVAEEGMTFDDWLRAQRPTGGEDE